MSSTIQAVIEKAGGWRPLARKLGIKAQSIQNWKKVPAERVLDLEKITGIPRWKLRPDIYPPNDYLPPCR